MVIDRHHRAARIAWPGGVGNDRRLRTWVGSALIWATIVVAGSFAMGAAGSSGSSAVDVAPDAGAPIADAVTRADGRPISPAEAADRTPRQPD